jgi:uncharacterized protein YeaO (DUF488 family)
MIQIKRAYEPPEAADGKRFLVDRIWPRGVKKEALDIEGWVKEVAPSNDLRKWFGHDPEKWDKFQQRYFAELESKEEALGPIRDAAEEGTVTLVYGAKDTEHNNAAALKSYLEEA